MGVSDAPEGRGRATFSIPRQAFDEIVAHANEEYPNECCGIAIGDAQKIREVIRARNLEASPYRYRIEPLDIRDADKLVRDRGWDIIGFYHSHTATNPAKTVDAYPSETDINESRAWPDSLYLILSLKDRANPQLRAFHIHDGQVLEQELQLV